MTVRRLVRGNNNEHCNECKMPAHIELDVARFLIRLCMHCFREFQGAVNKDFELLSSAKPKR